MASLARRRRAPFDIWPGFVDALATLLILIIFLLMIFMVAQFYLNEVLSGRDKALDRLNSQITELADMLSLERTVTEDLRHSLTQLSSELQSSVELRDHLGERLLSTVSERDTLAATLARLQAELAGTEEKATELAQDLTAREDRLAALMAELRATQSALAERETRIQSLDADFAAATTDIEARRRQIEALIADLAVRSNRIEALDADLAARNDRIEALDADLAARDDRIEALDADLAARNDRIEALDADLAARDDRIEALDTDLAARVSRIEALDADLAARDDRIEALDTDLAARVSRIDELDLALAAARVALAEQEGQAGELSAELDTSQAALADREDRLNLLITALMLARERLEQNRRSLSAEKQISDESLAQIEILNMQLAVMRQQIARLAVALEASEADADAQQVQIASLGQRLNAALASRVEELARYRSEFFGRLREVLGDREDIQIVGDRFVFQSDVLFASGSAELDAAGARQIGQLGRTLIEIAVTIPQEINWILRVDGHTDLVPIATFRYPTNWALSTARAVSVVKFLIEAGVPAERLAATGFGEFQPLDTSEGPAAYARNRRIELRLDQR